MAETRNLVSFKRFPLDNKSAKQAEIQRRYHIYEKVIESETTHLLPQKKKDS